MELNSYFVNDKLLTKFPIFILEVVFAFSFNIIATFQPNIMIRMWAISESVRYYG